MKFKTVVRIVVALIAVLWIVGLVWCIWWPGEEWVVITTAWGDYLIASALIVATFAFGAWRSSPRGRTWYCEAEGVGMEREAGVCSPERRFHHNPPCGWQ